MSGLDSRSQAFIKKHSESIKEQIDFLPVPLRPYWFGFERHYADGYCFLLTTNEEVYIHHFNYENLLVSTPQCDNLKSNMEFDYKAADRAVVGRMKDEMGYFAHGDTLILICYTEKYFDVFYFSFKSVEISFFSNLLNNLFVFKKFARNFLSQFEKIIGQNEGCFILPRKMRNPYIQSRYIPDRVWLEELQQYVGLTKKELKTCLLAVRGLFQSEMAEKMNISARTVEAHLANAKNKLKVTKEEFIEIFFNYF